MAAPEDRSKGESQPTTRAPDRSPFTGITVTVIVAVVALVAIAFLAGAFTGDDADNAALEGPVAGETGEWDGEQLDQGEAQ